MEMSTVHRAVLPPTAWFNMFSPISVEGRITGEQRCACQQLQNIIWALPLISNVLVKQVCQILVLNSTLTFLLAGFGLLVKRLLPRQVRDFPLFVPDVNYKQNIRFVGLLKVSVHPGNTLPFCTLL